MEFRVWLEASVSSKSLSDAIEKTLIFMVDGKWRFQDRGSVVFNAETSRKIQIRKTAELLRSGRMFRLSLDAGFSEAGDSIGLGPFSHKQYDTSEGLEDLEIKCMLWRDEELIGKRGFSGDSTGNSSLGRSLPLKSPMELATWIKEMTDDRPYGGGGNSDDEPFSPNPENSPFAVGSV